MGYKVSVIVPVYNAEQYLEHCIDTLMRQTLKELEYIFIEDCSTDGSYDVLLDCLSKYPERKDDIRIIKHDTNKGVSATRNEGIEAASGEYIIHCDSDDWTDVTMYEKMYSQAIKDKAEICFCDFYTVTEAGTKTIRQAIDTTKAHDEVVYDYIVWTWNTLWSVMVSRDVYSRSGLRIPEWISFSEDFFLMVGILHYANGFTSVKEPLYHYNLLNASSIIHLSDNILEMEISCCEHLVEWMKGMEIYDKYALPMAWRFIRAKGGLVYFNGFEKFRTIHPETHRHILSLPTVGISLKQKAMMVLTVLHLDFLCRWDNHMHGRY